MRFYINSKYEIICAPNYHEKFGNVTGDSILINTGTFTNKLEEEVTLAVEEVLKKYQHTVPKELVGELFAEKKRQVRQSYDTSSALTEYMDKEGCQ
ncbi:hypothetical protein [Streptococcus vestibularis]|uniref:hypothetical protein n=1 Tax=Streptococcus vestibularis TaxID=1343 RepID=UPI001D0B8678|nr:hypothetical protein [Streptococcus vestibularis]MCB8556834.1 hypothetical protein [Streptococcus vestibularis]MCB8587624.1 hypothetical protein [Streptococcus vestibularis]